MRIIASLAQLQRAKFVRGSAVAVGKFDGVHLGHRAIIAALRADAAAHDLESVVFTFRENPLALLCPERCPQPLSSPEQRLELLEKAGVECAVMVDFDAEFARITAHDFVQNLLVGVLGARELKLGADFRFGKDGSGDSRLLQRLGAELGFNVAVMPQVHDVAHGVVSSSRIRQAVSAGDVALAGLMLGQDFAVRGEVVHGDARGRELGFPTANLGGYIEGLIPAAGVYAGTAEIAGVVHQAAISVGVNLTFDPHGDSRVEAHLLDFCGDLYGQRIALSFVDRLRPMLSFDSAEGLIARMGDDVRETRLILAQRANR